ESVARSVFRDATVLIAVSKEVADYLEGFPSARGRVRVIPNGVDPERFAESASNRHQPKNGLTIGFVGSFKPWHGLLILLEAFALYRRQAPEVRLLLVGDGPERQKLMEAIESYELQDAVEMSGAVSPAAIPRWLAAMDVAVAPYPALEG